MHFRDIGQDMDKHDVTYENGQARERTQVLMDLANQSNGLVIGTGDMSELALGWATYNGDHMSMYGVNVGVPKTLVRHLVAYCANTCSESEKSAAGGAAGCPRHAGKPRAFCRRRTERSARKQRIWSAPTSSMISFISAAALWLWPGEDLPACLQGI